jgi:hypothetical protein
VFRASVQYCVSVPPSFVGYSNKLSRMNTPFAREYTMLAPTQFCATDVSSGLAAGMTLTRVSQGMLEESITRGWTCFRFHFCTVIHDCCRLRLKWYTLHFCPRKRQMSATSGRWQ